MPVSGSVPNFSLEPRPPLDGSPTVLSVSGAVSGTAIGGNFGDESLPSFYRRALGLLAMSGTVSGADHQIVSGSTLSGMRNLQQELALRIADIEMSGSSSAARLAHANAILTGSGEVLFGS